MKLIRLIFFLLFVTTYSFANAQDSSSFKWNASSKKIADGEYEISFKTKATNGWQLYAPNQKISDVPAAQLLFSDSSIVVENIYKENGINKTITSKIFDNASFKIYEGDAEFIATIKIKGTVPANLIGTFKYTYGKSDEFYPLIAYQFSVPLEGGVAATTRIKIKSFDLKNPVSNCGDESTEGKGLTSIFLLGLVGGFIALLTPCVFPLIPLTVSFFTKRAANRKKELRMQCCMAFLFF